MNGFIVSVAGTLDDVIIKAFDEYSKAELYVAHLWEIYHTGVMPGDVERILTMLSRDMSTIEAINIYDMRNSEVWEIHTKVSDE